MKRITLTDARGAKLTLEPRLMPCLYGDMLTDKDSLRIADMLAREPNLTPERAAEIVSKGYREEWRDADMELQNE